MCSMCSSGESLGFKSEPNTPERAEEIRAKRNDDILRVGHSVVGVIGSHAYTVGRAVMENPELVMSGDMNMQMAANILNDIAEQENAGLIDLGNLADHNVETDLGLFQVPLRFIWADPVAAEMTGAIQMTPFLRAIQVVWPDPQGRWPENPGFQGSQTVYPRSDRD